MNKQDERRDSNSSESPVVVAVFATAGMGGEAERCELCGATAAVHCAADAAFLCASCDARVHGANFLASRHTRRRLAGPAGCQAAAATAEAEDEGYASAASSCVSTAADSASTTGRRGGRAARRPQGRRRRSRGAEAVLEGWAKRMGLAAGEARRCSAAAGRALRPCGPDVVAAAAARVPLRVAMAAALWREVAAGSGDALRRLEACAHVPARLVVAVAASVTARARARTRPAVDAVEGWDECSSVGPEPSPARS